MVKNEFFYMGANHRYWDTFMSNHIHDTEFNSANLHNKHEKPL